MTITLPTGFRFTTTVNSHGWYDLPPFKVNERFSVLSTVISLSPKKHAVIELREQSGTLLLKNISSTRLTRTEQERTKNIVRSMLRLEEPLTEFYALCRTLPHLRWVPKRGAGRVLRAPTVFEDVVKMLFTTNCSWALTKIQTVRLTSTLGTPVGDGRFSFPTPEAILRKNERWLRANISCGYRAPSLLRLCRSVAEGDLDLESLRSTDAPTEEVYETLRSIHGIGHYATGNILKLLGRYDHLGIDSWVRSRFAELHRRGRKSTDAAIERHYDQYRKWRGLVCLMEVTADWHT